MVEYNPDGSLKLPSRMTRQADENNTTFLNKPSFKIVRHQISSITPLTCEVTIDSSKHIDPSIVEAAFNEAKANFKNESMLSISKGNNQHTVKIVSGFNRCAWCQHFIDHLADRANARIMRTDNCNNKSRN